MKRTKGPLVLLLSLVLLQVQAQQISTDRPDQSDGASIVEGHKWQLETSLYYTSINNHTKAYISSSLLRYGIFKKLEVRLLVEQGSSRNTFMTETAQSQYPLAISAKWALLEETKHLPAISVVGYLQLPFTNGAQPNQWSSAVLLIIEKEWSPVTFTCNVGPKEAAFSPEWTLQATGNIKLALSERLNVFAEYFAQYGDDAPFHNVDAGILYYINNRLMLHVAGGSSIDHDPGNYFLNTGFAIQFH